MIDVRLILDLKYINPPLILLHGSGAGTVHTHCIAQHTMDELKQQFVAMQREAAVEKERRMKIEEEQKVRIAGLEDELERKAKEIEDQKTSMKDIEKITKNSFRHEASKKN